MPLRRKWTLLLLTAAALLAAGAAWSEREWRVYKSFEDDADDSPVPADFNKPAGFVVGRLMYPSNVTMGWRGFGGFVDWRRGGTSWAVDYPRGDRYFASILRRLTTVDVRSVEQPVNLEDGNDVFDWPYLIVGLAGYWNLSEGMAGKLREYLLRGGFLLADSFFGSDQWEGFTYGMHQVFPDRDIVDLPDNHPLFHTIYNLDTRHMVPHFEEYSGQAGGMGNDGQVPHWRGILDDKGRVMVAIAFNNDLGDSYQWADDPRYPGESATLACAWA